MRNRVVMALENKLLRDANGIPVMNDFQKAVFVAEQMVDTYRELVKQLR